MVNIKEVLKEQISLIKPTKQEEQEIRKEAEKIIQELKKKIKNKKIRAEVFLGGSLAKKTLVKKEKPDIDIFVRFDKKYEDDKLSGMLSKIVGNKNTRRIHGSRDYFQISKKGIIFEIVPVVEIAKPQEARNVTDLSYFHVNYVKNKIRQSKRLADEIILAKSFCYAQDCYGAESYIRGFSGYAIELLVIYYRGFLNFLKAIQKTKIKVIVLDPKKHYKTKDEIMLNLNESKLQSPIVFVDPTFKERNALAALSKETFEKFKSASRKFLKNPTKKAFEKQEIQEKQFNLIIQTKTNRQKGDIAGSKLRKFHNFLLHKMDKYFDINKKEFRYIEKENKGVNYFKVDRKKEIIYEGPRITDAENLTRFKKAHKGHKCLIKQGRAYCKEKINTTPRRFISDLKKKDKKRLREIGIREVKIL